MESIVFKEFVSNPMFVGVLAVALALLGAGIILRLFASGFVIAKAFSSSVYDLTVLVFLYWIVFMLQVQYGVDAASGFVTNLPFISYFPNPFDVVALGHTDLGVAFWGAVGRIWFISFQIELFTKVILDMFPTVGFIWHYMRQSIVVILTIILNTALLYYMGQVFSDSRVDLIFTILLVVVAIAIFVMGFLIFRLPGTAWLGSDLMECFLVPTFATVLSMLFALILQAFGLFTDIFRAIDRFTDLDIMIYCVLMLLMFMLWALLYRLLRGK